MFGQTRVPARQLRTSPRALFFSPSPEAGAPTCVTVDSFPAGGEGPGHRGVTRPEVVSPTCSFHWA